MKRILIGLLFLLVFVIGFSFALKNMQTVELDYYFGLHLGPVPLSLLMIAVFALGILLGGLVVGIPFFSRRWQLRRMRHRTEVLEQELASLRNPSSSQQSPPSAIR